MGDHVANAKLEEEFHALMDGIKVENVESVTSIQNTELNEDSTLDVNVTDDDKPYQSLCRLCANPAENMVDIFEAMEKRSKNVIEKIQYCLPIDVKDTNLLPKTACELCLAMLELSYQFHKNVLEAEKRLLVFYDNKLEKRKKETESRSEISGKNDSGNYRSERKEELDEDLNRNNDDVINQMPILSQEFFKTDTNFENDYLHSSNFNVRKSSGDESQNADLSTNALSPDKESTLLLNTLIYKDEELRRNEETSETVPYFLPIPRSQIGKVKKKLRKETSPEHEEPFSTTSADQFRDESRLSDAVKKKQDHIFECGKCKRRFGSRHVLVTHEKTCRSKLQIKKQYSCDFCGKSLTRKSALVIHMRSHTGERPYGCEFCSKKFTRKADRDNHHKIHTGERPYPCDFCPKTFTTVSSRNAHHRSHTGERPFECFICKKSFTYSGTRRYHMVTHASEKPYQCNMCEKRFSARRYLSCHKKNCHSL